MATLVLEQDESVKMIETQAVQVNADVENGCVPVVLAVSLASASDPANMPHSLNQTKRAVKSARRARRMRWACFIITVWSVACLVIAARRNAHLLAWPAASSSWLSLSSSSRSSRTRWVCASSLWHDKKLTPSPPQGKIQ